MTISTRKNKKFAVCALPRKPTNQPKINLSTTTKAYRKTVSFKCNEELWQTFKTACRTNGTSICHILEAMVTAYVSLADLQVNFGDTYTVENLNVQRVVQKHRRVSHEYFKEPNFYDGKGRWVFVAAASLNENGHALGCCCKACACMQEAV